MKVRVNGTFACSLRSPSCHRASLQRSPTVRRLRISRSPASPKPWRIRGPSRTRASGSHTIKVLMLRQRVLPASWVAKSGYSAAVNEAQLIGARFPEGGVGWTIPTFCAVSSIHRATCSSRASVVSSALQVLLNLPSRSWAFASCLGVAGVLRHHRRHALG